MDVEKYNINLGSLVQLGFGSEHLIRLINKFDHEIDECNLFNIFGYLQEDIYLDVALVIYKKQNLDGQHLGMLFETLIKIDHELVYEVYLDFRNKDIEKTIDIIKCYNHKYMKKMLLWNESSKVLKKFYSPLPKWYYGNFKAWEELFLINQLDLPNDIITIIVEILSYKKLTRDGLSIYSI